jgi:hypothetical protein
MGSSSDGNVAPLIDDRHIVLWLPATVTEESVRRFLASICVTGAFWRQIANRIGSAKAQPLLQVIHNKADTAYITKRS